jgi:hypothetical protein
VNWLIGEWIPPSADKSAKRIGGQASMPDGTGKSTNIEILNPKQIQSPNAPMF